jgi:hypothetical protein
MSGIGTYASTELQAKCCICDANMHILQESSLLRWNAGLVGVSRHFEGNRVPSKFQETPNNAISHSTTSESPTQLSWKPQIIRIHSSQNKNKKKLQWGEMT